MRYTKVWNKWTSESPTCERLSGRWGKVNIYEKCVKQKAIFDELNRKMEEAYEGVKLALDEAFEYREKLEIPPNVELLDSLNKRATDAQKEVKKIMQTLKR